MNKPVILVIEDDPSVSKLIAMTLQMQNYAYMLAKTGKQGVQEILSTNPDIIILDLGLPDMDGIDLIQKVRGWSHVPIIVVSARGEDKDKIQALDEGADDYLTKPFSVDELSARIRVTLRRLKAEATVRNEENPIFENGQLTIDFLSNTVYVNQQAIHVTPIEYKLLTLFAKNMDRVLTYTFILKEVWGIYDNDSSALRVFMTTLRKKIEADPANPQMIQTHIGIGYRMVSCREHGTGNRLEN